MVCYGRRGKVRQGSAGYGLARFDRRGGAGSGKAWSGEVRCGEARFGRRGMEKLIKGVVQ